VFDVAEAAAEPAFVEREVERKVFSLQWLSVIVTEIMNIHAP
jgi:hypothetical protein